MEILSHKTHNTEETLTRTMVKTISYRLLIVILDFTALYLFTGKLTLAIGFTIVSNIYTTIGYFAHERIWDKIKWGRVIYKKDVAGSGTP
jgi:uncharacterized membrane protein